MVRINFTPQTEMGEHVYPAKKRQQLHRILFRLTLTIQAPQHTTVILVQYF